MTDSPELRPGGRRMRYPWFDLRFRRMFIHHFTIGGSVMRHSLRRPAPALAVIVLSFSPALAVQNGTLDGNGHPAIGSLQANTRSDPCPLGDQVDAACSAVLIAPDLLL